MKHILIVNGTIIRSNNLLVPNIYRIYRNLPGTYVNLNRPITCLSHFLTVENDDIVCV